MNGEAGKNRITANSIKMIRLEKKLGAKVFHRSKMLNSRNYLQIEYPKNKKVFFIFL